MAMKTAATRSGMACIHMFPVLITLMFKATVLISFCLSVSATVTTVDRRSYDSLPAQFGMTWQPQQQYQVRLVYLKDNPTLCNVINGTSIPDSGLSIALLARRGNCNFEEKARNAQAHSDFLVVYDDEPHSVLIPMSATNPADIDIGLLFVSYATGTALLQQLQDTQSTVVSLDSNLPRRRPTFDDTQEFVLAVMSGILSLLAFFGCLVVCVHTGYIRREGNVIIVGRDASSQASTRLLSREDVLNLPELTFHQNDAVQSCAVCIEEYHEGEFLRRLPCGHVFHTDCIGPWLTQRQANCPLCKLRVNQDEEKKEQFLGISGFLSRARRRGELWRRGSEDSALQQPLLQDPRSPPPPDRSVEESNRTL